MRDNNLKFNKTINKVENKNPQQKELYIKRQKTKEILMKQFNLSSEEAERKLRKIEKETLRKPLTESLAKETAAKNAAKKPAVQHPKTHSNKKPISQHVFDEKNNIKPHSSKQTISKTAVQKNKEINKEPNKPVNQKPPIKTEENEKTIKTNDYLNLTVSPETTKTKQKGKTTQPPENLAKSHIENSAKKTPQKEIDKSSDELTNVENNDTTKNVKKSKFNNIFNRNKKNKETEVIESSNPEKNGKDIDDIIDGLIQNYSEDISIELSHVDLSFEVQEDQIDNLKEQIIRTIKRNKGKTEKLHVLKDVSFKIYQGEKVGVIGYNAAGKSTLLKLITGIYKPDNGSVITNGKISPLLTLGAGFDNNFSGAKNIYLNGAILGYDKEFIDEKYDEIVEFAGLGKAINYPIRNYSSGMKAKLGFSVATMVEPDILIIDEILGVGDVSFKRKSRDKMKSLMGGKTTVLLVSHSLAQIRDLCDKAIWIDQGRVREIGEVNQVCDNYIKDSKRATQEQLKDIQFN